MTVLAVGLSAFAIWTTSYQPFNARATLGSVIIVPTQEPGEKDVVLHFVAPITVFNEGVRSGFVRNIVLVVRSDPPGRLSLFYPAIASINTKRLVTAYFEKKGELTYVDDAFAGIAVEPKSAKTVTLLFKPEPRMQGQFFSAGNYTFSFLMSEDGKEFEEIGSLTQGLDDDAFARLQKGIIMGSVANPQLTTLQKAVLREVGPHQRTDSPTIDRP